MPLDAPLTEKAQVPPIATATRVPLPPPPPPPLEEVVLPPLLVVPPDEVVEEPPEDVFPPLLVLPPLLVPVVFPLLVPAEPEPVFAEGSLLSATAVVVGGGAGAAESVGAAAC